MSYVAEIKNVLTDFEKHKVQYALLRNYEFLLDSAAERGFDLDLVMGKNDFVQAAEILLGHGFVKYPRQFSLTHRGFGKYFTQEQVKFGFDIQVGGIHWNDITYLSAEKVLERRVNRDGLYILSDEDAFIMYVCHSLLGKRKFKEKYKLELLKLNAKDLNYNYIFDTLSQIFNAKLAKDILWRVKEGKFSALERKSLWYAGYYVLHKPKNIIPFNKLFFRWLRWLRIGRSYPLISFIGPDGSGKSTAAEHLVTVLKKNRRDTVLVYMGRGKKNILPIKKMAGKYKKHEEKEEKAAGAKPKQSTFKQKIIYGAAAPIYTFDLLIRYLTTIFPWRKRKKIIVTDRYCSDILLMPHVPFWFKRLLLFFFPKPTLTFYLHQDAKVLYERRKQQPVEELERQMKLFDELSKKLNAVSIQTISFEKDTALIEEKVFTYFMKNRY